MKISVLAILDLQAVLDILAVLAALDVLVVLETLEELDVLDFLAVLVFLEELEDSRIAWIASCGGVVGDLEFFYYICYSKCALNHEKISLYYLDCRVRCIDDAL